MLAVIVVALASAASAALPAAVEIVLDASGGMHRPGIGGVPIHATVREALLAVIAEAPAARPNLVIGLRLAGGEPSADHIESCSATSVSLPLAGPDPRAWIRVLDDLGPRGFRPLTASVVAALGDLDPHAGNRRVVVVTSGDDQCGGGPQQVAAALAAADRPAELRMVGLGLAQTVLDRFGGVPVRNATTAGELIAALRWAILDLEDRPRPNGRLVLRLSAGAAEAAVARVDAFDQATGEIHSTTVVKEAGVDLPAGRYRLTVKPETGGQIEFRDLLVPASTESRADLDLSPPQPVAVDVGSDPVFRGAPTWVDVGGFPPPGARVQFVDGAGAAVTRPTEPSDEEGWIDSPSVTGPLELLLVGPESSAVRRVLARRPVTVVSGDPGLTAPDEIAAGSDAAVGWSRSAAGGDIVGMVPRDGTPADLMSCFTVGWRIEGSVSAPTVAAELDLVVVDGVTLSVAARRPLRITVPEVTLDAPARVVTGERIEVAWSGPEGREDFVSLAIPGSPDLDYLEWARVEDGNPSVLPAPRAPGKYELRYVDGEKAEVRARAGIDVAAVPIELAAPDSVPAGIRFEIAWTGPASPGDIITLSRPDAAPDRYFDWASITVGSPLTLAAPTRPGSYEIRYLSRNGLDVLAQIAIEVRP